MGCCEGCGQTILVLINILFSVIGIVLLVVGCIVRFGSDLLDTYLQDAYTAFQKVIEDAAQGQNVDIGNLDIGDLLGDASLAFIVIGAFFFILGILGCIGACCKVRFLLIVYTIFLITVFVAEVVFVVLLFTIKPTIDGWLRDPIVDKLKSDYTGTNGSDPFTLAINFVMHEFDCCGIYKAREEFANTSKWNQYYNTSSGIERFQVPLVCCRDTNISEDTSCALQPNNNNSYVDEGCYDAVNDWLTDHSAVLIGVGAGVAAVQLILIIFSIVICWRARKDNDDDKSSYSDEDIPIQPYRESREASGHRNMYYEGEPEPYRSEIRNSKEYDNPRGQPDVRGSYPEPYKGRTDYYTGPPQGYRSGPPPHQGYRDAGPNEHQGPYQQGHGYR